MRNRFQAHLVLYNLLKLRTFSKLPLFLWLYDCMASMELHVRQPNIEDT